MDQISQDQIQKKLNNKYEFLKRTLQFVFSVTVFSFFVWYSSGFSILPQSFNAYFSTCLFSMLTHTLERKYMFLICNGILAFLAKNLLLTSSPPISAFDIEFQASNPSETKEPVAEEALFLPAGSSRSPENAPFMVEEELEMEKLEEYNEQATTGEEEVEEKDEEDEEGGTGSGVLLKQDDELAERSMETNEELADTDELNRKFEEFIRKMKEEIRVEAQRKPIAV